MSQHMLPLRNIKGLGLTRRIFHYNLLGYFKNDVRSFKIKSFPSSQPVDPKLEKSQSKLDPITLHRLRSYHGEYYKRKMIYNGIGVIIGMVGIYITAIQAPLISPTPEDTKSPSASTVNKLDSIRPTDDPLLVLSREKKIITQKSGDDFVPTGNSVVPEFPCTLTINHTSTPNSSLVNYQLLGMGIRTVSFLRIQVYVVGIYIASDDLAALQKKLIKLINPFATTLIASEKDYLKSMLLDPETGEQIWDDVLRDNNFRMLVRVVPTRNTDFGHLRDGWVRAITARAQKFGWRDERFGDSMNEFKRILARGSVPKGKEILLSRDTHGEMGVWYKDGLNREKLGNLKDERVSRAVWLGYLAGQGVACEDARNDVVAGLLRLVERPVGTVVGQT